MISTISPVDRFPDQIAWLTRRDGSVIIGHGPFLASAEPADDKATFYMRDFAFADAKPWKIPSSVEQIRRSELPAYFGDFYPLDCEWETLDAAPFSRVFQQIMVAIRSGAFEKTVPALAELGFSRNVTSAAIAAAMAQQAPPLHSYGWSMKNAGFAGATPELLFSLHGNRLETMALAGTARSEDHDVFAVDEKEIREHEYVSQTLVSKLLDLGKVERRSREILSLGSIVHFLTLIQVDLEKPQTVESLLRRLHPTPALGPLPCTPETLQMLYDWRAQLGCPREFGAPFGVWHDGNFEAVVAIRGIWWNGRQLTLPAGCGLIEASRLVNEWRELRLKRDSVKSFFSDRL